MSRVFPALVSLSFLAACGGGGGDDAFDAAPPVFDAIDAAPILLAPPPDGQGFQVRVAEHLAGAVADQGRGQRRGRRRRRMDDDVHREPR